MAINNSPNMNLPVPGVGNEAGPQYAFDINSCLSLIDQHDHSTGKGVQITPAGININSNLSFNSNSAVNLVADTFITQVNPPANQSVFVKAAGSSPIINELFYVDSAGQQVQLTKNGIVNATFASLTGWSYSSGTWTATQAVDSLPTTPASISAGNVTLKPIVASTPFSVTLQPPSAIASQYSIKMPLLPSSQSFMTIDNSGNEAAPIAFSQGITAANIAPLTITDAQIANQTIDPTKLATTGAFIDNTSSPYSVSQMILFVVCNASVAPISVILPDPSTVSGKAINIKKFDTSLNAITVTTVSGNIYANSSGNITPTLNTSGEEWEFTSDGFNWAVTSHLTKTAPQSMTPVINGWSSSATNVRCYTYRDGSELVYSGSFLSGNTSASTASMTVGFNNAGDAPINTTVYAASPNNIPVGHWGSQNQSNATGSMFTNTSSLDQLFFGVDQGGNKSLAIATSAQVGGASNQIGFSGRYQVQGWFA